MVSLDAVTIQASTTPADVVNSHRIVANGCAGCTCTPSPLKKENCLHCQIMLRVSHQPRGKDVGQEVSMQVHLDFPLASLKLLRMLHCISPSGPSLPRPSSDPSTTMSFMRTNTTGDTPIDFMNSPLRSGPEEATSRYVLKAAPNYW